MAIRSMFGRRRFLQGAAAFASTPLFLPGTVLGLGPRRPPSDRITLGFIGMGKMNRGHLNWFLRQDDVQVLAVCDVDTTRRESAKSIVDQKYDNSDCASYNDDSDLLKREDIDAVVIATPDHWHAHAIIEACKTGKDIYCEKPLTLTILEAKRCIDAVREHDRVFQTGSQQRSGQEFRKACELVRNGYIGEIEKVIVGVGGPSRWCDLDEYEMEE
jgi:predicted dehydrogenase